MSLNSWDSKVYAVEISGWDVERQFFVEHTSLYRDGAGAKTVMLQHHLRNGLFVFIRELSSGSADKEYPSIYRVELAGAPDRTGFSKVRLSPQSLREVIYDATSEPIEHLNQQWQQ